jgi:proton-translocating NADH-quinone oxidoreductase chain M
MNILTKNIIFYISTLLFFFTSFLWITFNPYNFGYQHIYCLQWFDFKFFIGIDGLSLFFIYLTTFLIPLCLLFSWNNNTKNNYYSMLFLISIEILLIFVFSVIDLLLFYIFFEAILIPFFVFIGINGYRKRRIHAAYLLFFYTLFGSLLLLISIFAIYLHCGTTDIQLLWNSSFSNERENLFWIFFFLAFAVKIPIFPFHIWLPEAHVEAPTEGSVLLAGVLLKLGTYGMLRFLFPIFPNATVYFSPLVLLLSTIAVFYTSFTTLRQIDIKRIVAYSSVSHMNMCVIGLFTFDPIAISGSILLMIGHGLVSGGLFFLIGVMYNRFHTKIIKYYSGLVQLMPLFAFLFFFLRLVI